MMFPVLEMSYCFWVCERLASATFVVSRAGVRAVPRGPRGWPFAPQRTMPVAAAVLCGLGLVWLFRVGVWWGGWGCLLFLHSLVFKPLVVSCMDTSVSHLFSTFSWCTSAGTGSWTLCQVSRVRASHSDRSLDRQVRGARAQRFGLVVWCW